MKRGHQTVPVSTPKVLHHGSHSEVWWKTGEQPWPQDPWPGCGGGDGGDTSALTAEGVPKQQGSWQRCQALAGSRKPLWSIEGC